MSSKAAWHYVWVQTSRGVSPQIWAHNPDSRGPDSRSSGPIVLKHYPMKAEHIGKDGLPLGLHDLVSCYPAP